ncbi:MAG TPA: LptF/LptG family permease [Spirochaetia bacterium]|nr:LptF/LptG family permease [Spirochaetia bacterium]
MNRALLGRVGSFLFAFYVLGFGVLFLWALVGFSPQTILPSQRWMYALVRGFTLFMEYLLPIHAAAIAVGASLSGNRMTGSPAEPFSRVVSSTLVTFLLLSIAYTLAFEIGYPAALRRLEDMQASTAMARQLRAQAELLQKNGDYRSSLDMVERYLLIDRDSRDMTQMKVTLESQAARKEAPAPARSPAGADQAPTLSAQALVEKAKYYATRGDWFSAHYYAQKASALDPRRIDALQLASEASQKISGLAASQPDAASARTFQEKRDAYLQLTGGNFLAAYYSFVRLAAKYPRDTDVATYLGEASREVSKVSFFLDEARRVEPMPGTQQILFFNAGGQDALEAVAIGRMIQIREGTYFLDVEAVRYDGSGRVVWHLTAPYGKLENGTILLRCIDRSDPGVQFLPVYLTGSRPAQERNFLAVQPSEEELRYLSASPNALADMGPVELWRMRESLPGMGRSRAALTVELMMKLVMPFAFLILSLISLAMGWAFRVRGGARPGAFGVILTPLVPVALAVFSLLYLYGHRVILGFTVLAFGLTAAVIVGAALELVLLVGALTLLAGQSSA